MGKTVSMKSWDKLFTGSSLSELNTLCDSVYYINLDSRTDRLESIQNQLISNKIVAQRFGGIIPENVPQEARVSKGELGCSLSHLAILQNSIDLGNEIICILEDDIIFKKFFPLLFSRFISHVPEDWDMLYLCGNNLFGLEKINDYVFKTRGTLTTCAYIVKQKMSLKILDYIGNGLKKPIDSYLAELHTSTNTYVAVPSLAYQMTDYSDIQNRVVDYGFLY